MFMAERYSAMKTNAIVRSIVFLIAGVMTVAGQEAAKSSDGSKTAAPANTTVAITANSTPTELAQAAIVAQGGEKFRKVQNMMLRGSVQLYAPNSVQSIPGQFSIVTAGDKLRMEIDARPAVVFKQIYDGERSYSSMPGVEVPPLTKFGLGALVRYDQPGYKVSAIADKKKQRGFRIVDPDGYTTDFYIDPNSGRVMSFLIYYNGFTFGTDNSKFKEVEGVLVPFNFSQRFEMAQGAFFAEYSVKEVKLNQTLAEDAFTIPN
ncbi:MAG: hypothetical protein C5B55_08595 [Blastocatellia bacterium]|nr:MAG: hypothetical protein C5B55_08595 [Blastocatellia bacterium]